VREAPSIRAQILEIEAARHSRVIVLAASNLEMDLLPPLYTALRAIGRAERLDIVLYCRGGVVNAARRIALLLDEFTSHLGLLIPHHCESAGTILALAAREIIAGPLAIFSPIDPLLQSEAPSGGAPHALVAQDVRLFSTMSADWFGLDKHEASARAWSAFRDSIFPTTLTSLYRCTLELQAIGAELLALHMTESPPAVRAKIVDQLLFGYHSHSYALTPDDVRTLGLPVKRDASVEDLAWHIGCELRHQIGAGVRKSLQDDWFDSAIATRDGGTRRRRTREELAPVWEPLEIQ
jgi:hypothetical protein